MSTRSAIIIEELDGTASGIYCHFDGYLSNQKPLLELYGEKETRELIGRGSISSLGEPGESIAYADRGITWDMGYVRRTGEDDSAISDASWHAVADRIGHNGYVYVFRAEEGNWCVSQFGSPLELLCTVQEDR
jgi:hypothetical protein